MNCATCAEHGVQVDGLHEPCPYCTLRECQRRNHACPHNQHCLAVMDIPRLWSGREMLVKRLACQDCDRSWRQRGRPARW